jgi:hypothetical protein
MDDREEGVDSRNEMEWCSKETREDDDKEIPMVPFFETDIPPDRTLKRDDKKKTL